MRSESRKSRNGGREKYLSIAGDWYRLIGVEMSETEIPRELSAALANSERARARFEHLAPSHQMQVIEWVAEAKRPETRIRRAEKAVEMLVAPRSG